MSVKGLNKCFFPSSVAVFGAEDSQDSMGRSIVANLLSGGFKGTIYPIQPGAREVAGLPVCSKLQAMGGTVDLAVLATPLEAVPGAIEDCSQVGVNVVVITTPVAQESEFFADILKKVRKSGIRLIGPQSWGVISPWAGVNAGLGRHLPLPGKLAVISRSAAICASILNLSLNNKIGFSIVVDLGDMLDVDCADLLDYMANHFRVGAILLQVDRLSNLRKFMSAARAASRIKPIIVLKTGPGQFDTKKANTSTGRLIIEDAIYEEVFKRAGIIRVETVEELVDCGNLVSKQPRPLGPNLAIITNVRTPGLMALDLLKERGLGFAELSPETVSSLDCLLPSAWSRKNPINIRTEVPPDVYQKVMEICFSSREIDGTLIILSARFLSNSAEVARSIGASEARKTNPVFAVWIDGEEVDNGRRLLNEAGIPTYDSPERAVKAFSYLYAYERNLRLLQEIPPRLKGRFAINRRRARKLIDSALKRGKHALSGLESLSLLRAYDLPVIPTGTALSAKYAVKLADNLGYPVNLRLPSLGIKDEAEAAGAVRTSLSGPREVKEAFKEIVEHARAYDFGTDFPGVLVQAIVRQPYFEFRIGSRQIPPFGPVLIFGHGGIRPEVASDQAIGIPPLNRLLASHIIERTPIQELLKAIGYSQKECVSLLEELLVNFSNLVIDFPEIEELEIDPFLVKGERSFAANAITILKPVGVQSPMHLIISSYPDEYETTAITKTGLKLFIRPIKPEDALLLQGLWATLSSRSIYYRFSRPIEKLTPDLLARFTQIDYDREIALVALYSKGKGEKMLAVARLSGEPGADLAEFSVLVGDPWQGLGVGAELLSRLIEIAMRRNIKRIWGLVLRENRYMLELARKVGFNIIPNEDLSQFEMSLDLSIAYSPEIPESFGK